MAQTLVSQRGIAVASGVTGLVVIPFDCQYAQTVTVVAQATSGNVFTLTLQASMDGGTTWTDRGIRDSIF